MISIVIPTLNSELVINDTLTSIIDQTYHCFEVLVIDGGSTDKTLSVIRKYMLNNDRIRLYSEPDKGIYDAMNKGIKQAQGEWIYFLGGDDRLYDEYVLEKVCKFLQEPFDVVYGDVESTRFNGRYGGEFTPKKLYEMNICHQAIFFRKKLFEKTGDFNLKYRGHADWDHNMRWFLNSKIKRTYIDMVIAEYADGGISSIQGDPIFSAEKRTKFVRYCLKSNPTKKLRPIIITELKASIKKGSLKNMFISAICYLRSFL